MVLANVDAEDSREGAELERGVGMAASRRPLDGQSQAIGADLDHSPERWRKSIAQGDEILTAGGVVITRYDGPIVTNDHPLHVCEETILALVTAPDGRQGGATGSLGRLAVFPVEVGEGVCGSWALYWNRSGFDHDGCDTRATASRCRDSAGGLQWKTAASAPQPAARNGSVI